MTNAEREAQIRERAKGHSYLTDNEFLLLRLLDEARAEIAAPFDAPTDEELAALIRLLWLKVKPTREAQAIRSSLSVEFDDPRWESWVADFIPDYVWDRGISEWRTVPPRASARERATETLCQMGGVLRVEGENIPVREANLIFVRETIARAIEQAEREAREETAKIADLYAERPPSGDHNNTRAAFEAGMDHRAGATDAAMCIADAIRALNTDNKTPAG